MAVDLSKVKNRATKNQTDKENRGKGSNPYVKLKDGETRYFYWLPPHKNMGGLPWVERLVHKRETPQGSKIPFKIRCQRDNKEQDQSKCYACALAKDARALVKAKGDEHDQDAQRYSARRDIVSQVYDVSALYDDSGRLVKKMKKCFLKHGTKEECPSCYLKESCEKGAYDYYMPVGIWDELLDHINEEGDVTDPKNALGIRVKRKGSGRTNTEYKSKIAKDHFEFSDGAIERMNKKLKDLTNIDSKPTGTSKELKKIYTDFFEMNDLDSDGAAKSDDDDDKDTGLPKCFGKYNEDKTEKRGCDDCDVRKECKKDDDDDDVDEKVERRPKSLDKLRESLKKDAKQGRHNRE